MCGSRPIVIAGPRVYKNLAMINRYATALVTLAGTLALILGLIYWLGAAPSLLSMHMLLGFLTVGGMCTVAIGQALSPGGSWVLALLGLAVGALTVYIGVNQAALLVGDFHWLVQVAHLLLGVLTIGIVHMIGARQRRANGQP